MKIISGTTEFSITDMGIKSCAVAIGKFDGIHIGHKEIISKIIDTKKDGLCATVFTFEPSPEELFSNIRKPLLDTRDEKRKKFKELGIELLIEFPLTQDTACMPPEKFMEDILWKQLHAGLIVSGTDLSFGYRGEGNAAMLQIFAKKKKFSYQMIEKVCLDGKEVSSTRIRETISKGEMESANDMLGCPYQINGTIIHGKHLGHTLLMPTVNILPKENKLLPPNGVYLSLSESLNHSYYGVTNIGFKPTVSNENILGVETYLYNFSGDLYGQDITTKLLHFMRPEQKFDDIDSLKKQLAIDKMQGLEYIKTNHFADDFNT